MIQRLFAWTAVMAMAAGCSPSTTETQKEVGRTLRIDSSLLATSGADEYGMKTYVMAFLKRGPERDQDSLTAARIQRAHLDNIKRMADEGVLLVAGPFLDDDEIRGIYLFNVQSVEEARALAESDPAIQAGRLEMVLRPWYGSAALLKVNEIHKTFWEKEI